MDGSCPRSGPVCNGEALSRSGVGLRVLTGQGAKINTTTASGRLVFGIFSALAEFERELISERTIAGLSAARARGRKGGRKFALTKARVRLAQAAMSNRNGSSPASRASFSSRLICQASLSGAAWCQLVSCLESTDGLRVLKPFTERVDGNRVKPIDTVPVILVRSVNVRRYLQGLHSSTRYR